MICLYIFIENVHIETLTFDVRLYSLNQSERCLRHSSDIYLNIKMFSSLHLLSFSLIDF